MTGASVWTALGGRLGRNIAAQAYSQIVTLGIQIGSIPLLIWAWGLETYGLWLLLSAVPAYLTLSDLGFTFVAKNSMSIAAMRGERSAAVEIFQGVLALLLVIVSGLAPVLLCAAWLVPFDSWIQLGDVAPSAARTAISSLVLSALLYQLSLLLCAGLRADGRPAAESFFVANVRLLETAAICVAAGLGAGIAGAALAGLSVRVASLAWLALWMHRHVGWLPIGIGRASRKQLRALLGPSLSYMLVPIANALLIQGPILILGAVAGPASVVLLSVTRTVSRLGVAGANMLNFAFTPEYSFAYGAGDRRAFGAHIRLHFVLLGLGLLCYLAVMALFSGWTVGLLSHEQVVPVASLTALMVIGVCFELIWTGLFSPISAVNEHRSASLIFAVMSAIALIVASSAPSVWSLATAVLFVHAAMGVTVSLVFAGLWRGTARLGLQK